MKKKIFKKKYLWLIFYFGILIYINLFVISIAFVFGDSMNPTLKNNQIVFLYKYNYNPVVGDIIVTNKNNPFKSNLVKRVIAIQGQSVVISSGKLYIDGKQQLYYYDLSIELDIIVPNGEVFLLGDNYKESRDSREIGTVKEEDLLGAVCLWN